MTDSFPRRQARTRGFSLGVPRTFTVSPDGARIVFLRSKCGTDPVTCLWTLDLATGDERLVADPGLLEQAGEADLPPEERARRERSREQAGGVVGYATDRPVTMATFPLAGQLYVAEFTAGLSLPTPPAPQAPPAAVPRSLPTPPAPQAPPAAVPRSLPTPPAPQAPPAAVPRSPRLVDTPGGVIDPRPDPTGSRVAYVSGGAVRVHDLGSRTTTVLAEPDGPGITYGLADFAAAEEIGRMRGYWWAPDGSALVVARVDESPVRRWHIADPANPDRTPAVVAYPAAGTPNARVTAEIITLDGKRTAVRWDTTRDEYLVDVTWDAHGLMIVVQPRDQRALRTLAVDPATGATTPLAERTAPCWVDVVPGVPARLASGAFLDVDEHGATRRLTVDGEPVTPEGLQVRGVADVDGDTVLLRAGADPASIGLWTWSPETGLVERTSGPGVHAGRLAGGTLVVAAQTLDDDAATTTVHREDATWTVASLADPPGIEPAPRLAAVTERALPTALLLPSWHRPGTRLPVLMDPYGGPHAQRVLAARKAYLTSQWFAEQGFAVVVVDGRGTPGKGPEFERAVHGDLAAPVLDDQVDALQALGKEHPDLDLDRVGIRGWSFGGYLAALAVLRRPDVFHAAVAGAPVTDWALYDTHYTERYLGTPEANPDAYERSSLIPDANFTRPGPRASDLPSPGQLTRPLLLVHGLADDNVVAAHTLRLSSALLAAGRPHSVLPLSGITHMTPQEVVAENLLLLQVDFLRNALGVTAP